MHPTLHETPVGLQATITGGAYWWVLQTLYQHGPSWEIVPPLLLGSAALVSALNTARNDAAKRRTLQAQNGKPLA